MDQMNREDLAAMCRERAGQAEEKSAEWYAYGTARAFLSGTGSVEWVYNELQKARGDCLFYAERDGDAPDSQYGTYRNYMMTKAAIYQTLLLTLQEAQVPNFDAIRRELSRFHPADEVEQMIATCRIDSEHIRSINELAAEHTGKFIQREYVVVHRSGEQIPQLIVG